ncbi:MAG: hypothetical protein H0W67_09835 [Gemmatimonadales bacterium]|nr:hypothetical protein [Gemmatimonadales bacterium]
MMLQVPVPPVPPTPPFDPNLIFMNDSGPPVGIILVALVLTAAVIILWPIMRAFGRRLEGRGEAAQPALRAAVDQLHERLGEVDAMQVRLSELEERLDFAERLLSQTHEPGRIKP